MKRSLSLILSIALMATIGSAQQTAEVTLTLNEKFFEVLLDAVFTNLQTPAFPIAGVLREQPKSPEDDPGANETPAVSNDSELRFVNAAFEIENASILPPKCDESIRLMREIDGVRTSVHFRDAKINAPIAFAGSYNPPLIGCIDFQGWADTTIELDFDKNSQTLIGRAKVSNVRLSGTGGIGSSLLARLVQSSIDNKINPINILQMDKVSFVVPVQSSGALKMKAVNIRHEIVNGAMNVHITYQFSKG